MTVLHTDDTPLPVVNQLKYLGVILQDGTNMCPQLFQKQAKLEKKLQDSSTNYLRVSLLLYTGLLSG